MKYLQSQGINYSFVKEINGVTTYKYTKTPELFLTLVSFYMQKRLTKGDNGVKKENT